MGEGTRQLILCQNLQTYYTIHQILYTNKCTNRILYDIFVNCNWVVNI